MRRTAVLLLAVAFVALTRGARAADRVELFIAAPSDVAQAIHEVVDELLAPHDVAIAYALRDGIDVDRALTRDPAAAPALARIHVAVAVAEAKLYLVDGAVERVLARSVARESDELMREELGLIILTAIETLQAGGPVGEAREAVRKQLGLGPPEVVAPPPPPLNLPPLPEPPPVEETAVGPAVRLGGALFYEGQGYASDQVVVHGPAIGLRLDARRITLAPGLSFDAHYRIPFEHRGELAGFQLQSLALRLLGHIEPVRTSQVTIALHAGISVDTLFLDPFLIAAPAVPTPSRIRVAPLPRFGPSLRLSMFGETSLALGVYLDVDAIGTRYVIQRGEEVVPLLSPLRVRPSLQIGIETTLFGAAMFADP